MESGNTDLLILILSIGFIVLILFVCVAIGAVIRIMFDVKKITAIGRKEAENIAQTMDLLGDKAKSFLTNSLVLDKVIPAILGAITVGLGAKKASEMYDDCGFSNDKKKKGRSSKRKRQKNGIFVEDEID